MSMRERAERGPSSWRAVAALVATLVLASVVMADGSPVGVAIADPGSGEWSMVRFPRIDRHTQYEPVEVAGRRAWEARSECSASAMAVSLAEVSLEETPILVWEWQVVDPLDVDHERDKAGDDFAARVYVTFPFDPARESFAAWARWRLARTLYGQTVPGRAIAYVWASREAVGGHWPSPYDPRTHVLAVESGDTKRSPSHAAADNQRGEGEGASATVRWVAERVDVLADYQRFFDGSSPMPQALVVMTDSDNTCRRTTARFARFRFEPR